jgi:hypothetical protein
MRALLYVMLLAGLCYLAYRLIELRPQVVVEEVTAATPAPIPTPDLITITFHPPPMYVISPGSSAFKAIRQMYPDVAVAGSAFNVMFMDQFNAFLQTHPQEVKSEDWIFDVARQVASRLGVKPLPVAAKPDSTR